MAKTRRKFDKQFKMMVIELSNTREDYPKLAEELGIRADLIYRWRREHLASKQPFTGNGNPRVTEDQAEVVKLRKQLKEAELERDILKKAVSIFSKSDGKYSNL
jgi:transposase